jgi:hypothetical protein
MQKRKPGQPHKGWKAAVKKSMARSPLENPTVQIEHCTFDGSMGDQMPTVKALADALAANAKAIEALARTIEGPKTLLHVGPKSTTFSSAD